MTIKPNTESYEREIMIEETGFREYDARWRYPEQINLRGVQALGMSIGTMMHERSIRPDIVVGHDYRSYSATIKQALVVGLMASGCRVHDIGLALSPVAYFAQFDLDCPAVAMVTASHNENGWTGVKMGFERPLTFGPDLMQELKDMTLNKKYKQIDGSSYIYLPNMKARYLTDLTRNHIIDRKLKAVVACGNGTACFYAPQALEMIGCEVIPLDCDGDFTFPRYNPNPEDMTMLEEVKKKVFQSGADIGFAFDGDGDRCGFVDNTGEEIFADKMGVILARYLSHVYEKKSFIADVKSTELFRTDPVLKERGAQTEYWKTGHSYIKRRIKETNALCGFEKSGHFFFNAPIGRGYDDGILSAIMICHMMDQYPDKRLSDLKDDLPRTWCSPTISSYCSDESKYGVVDKIISIYKEKMENEERIMGKLIREVITINGARIVLEDGTWGLIRASSNKPCVVIVVESPVSDVAMGGMFQELDRTLAGFENMGAYDQAISIAA